MNRITLFAWALLVALMYGTITHGTRGYVVRYYNTYKSKTCGDFERTCVYDQAYINNNLHPNHCWVWMNGFPDPGNESWPLRTGHTDEDFAPYSTATSILYIIVGLLILGTEAADVPSQRDAVGIALSLAWVGVSSFELHRKPTETSRHNDYAAIAPLLGYVGMACLERYGPIMSTLKLSLVALILFLTYINVDAALFLGVAIIAIGALYQTFIKFRIWTFMLALTTLFAATAAKLYGNEGKTWWLASDGHFHNRAECANDVVSEQLEDITHGLWHTFGALGILILAGPLLALPPLPRSDYILVFIVALAVILSAVANPNVLGVWLGLAYTIVLILALPGLLACIFYEHARHLHKTVATVEKVTLK